MKVTSSDKIHEYYQALLDKDPSYLGTFYVAVKTTSIFCISTCHARKPKFENVTFYTTCKEVVADGYRPCKICKPTEHAGSAPDYVSKALRLLASHPYDKIKDWHLRENSISPERLRRWFQKHHKMTFHAYQRMYRINNAYQQLQGGDSMTATAFQNGYESLSGFGYSFKKLIGHSPKYKERRHVILIHRLTTPLGPMFVCGTDKGICLIEFTDRKMLETELRDIQKLLGATILAGTNEHIKKACSELQAYFEGKLRSFRVAIDSPGTAFQQMVWSQLRMIPHGNTISYSQLASRLDQPSAIRAVASANGHNRIAIIIPCHRVIRRDGSLGGYGGGLERKRWLLQHEQGILDE